VCLGVVIELYVITCGFSEKPTPVISGDDGTSIGVLVASLNDSERAENTPAIKIAPIRSKNSDEDPTELCRNRGVELSETEEIIDNHGKISAVPFSIELHEEIS
jgi:hypothetical protein